MPTPSAPRSCSTSCWSKHRRASGVVFHAMHPGWADTPGVRESLPRFRALMGPLLRTPSREPTRWCGWPPTRARSRRTGSSGSIAGRDPSPCCRAPAPATPMPSDAGAGASTARASLHRWRRCDEDRHRRHRRVRARRGPHAPPSPRDHGVRVRHTNRRSCQHCRRRGRRPVGRGRHGIHRVQRSQLSRVPCTARSARRRDPTRRR